MAKRVSFSGQHFSIAQAAIHHIDVDASLGLFFSIGSPSYPIRFAGYRIDEVGMELRERLAELDRNSTMSLIAAVEAAFRIDYLQRCYRKERDEVSRLFREIYREKAANASLEREIFEVWKNNTVGGAGIIGDLRGAFKFRH